MRRLAESDLADVDALLSSADEALASGYPGDDGSRQPVHTVYIPANRIAVRTAQDWGTQARAAIDEYAGSAAAMADVTGIEPDAVAEVWPLVLAKLEREPVEDLRIDVEDGYGSPGDGQEDADTVKAVGALARAQRDGSAPPFWGIRFKSLEPATRRRGLRTLDLAIGTALGYGPLPIGWIVTLPKVTSVDQVVAMVEVCARLENVYGLEAGRLRFEVQVETPQAVLGADGAATVARMVHAAAGRCAGLHFGTYDYTAALGVAAAYQAMDHPAADHAKAVMALAAAGTGVRLSDGSTNVVPTGDRSEVLAGWALHARLVTRSLERAYFQGWDMHPAQLPTRYLATYVFFRRGLDSIASRLRGYLAGAGSGPAGSVLDEPATAQALAGFLVRGVRCGAVGSEEVEREVRVDFTRVEDLARRRAG
jgi:citrate lyase beta subunit